MDFIEAQEFIKKSYPAKDIVFEFSQDCIREIIFVYCDGKCNELCHVTYNKVNVTEGGEKIHSLTIKPHRINFPAEEMKKNL